MWTREKRFIAVLSCVVSSLSFRLPLPSRWSVPLVATPLCCPFPSRSFRWLQEAIIPRNPDNLELLQRTQCAYADDLAVATFSFRDLTTALAPACRSVDSIAGLNLNYRKCCWVQYGTGERESLRTWISEKCEEFREMQIVRHAKYVGTMIGPDGHLHRWSAPRKFIQRVLKIHASTKSLVDRLCDFKIYALRVLSFIGSVCAPDKASFKAENHALQCTTAGPYNAILSNLLGVGSVCGLGPGAARCRVAAWSTTLSQGLQTIHTAHGHNCTPIFTLSPIWEKDFLVPSMACCTADAFDIVCRLECKDTLDEASQNKKQEVTTLLLLEKSINKTLLGLFPVAPRKSWDRSVVIVLLTFCPT